MANVYIEVRSKSLPHGSRVEDYVFEDMLIMFCKLSRRSARPSTGHTGRVIIHSLHGSDAMVRGSLPASFARRRLRSSASVHHASQEAFDRQINADVDFGNFITRARVRRQ
jgi:hypothetical protein